MKKPFSYEVSKGKIADFVYFVALYIVALFGSLPLLTSSSPVPPGFDSVMHLSKIRIFSELFPQIPKWFPWWYCGTPSIRFYPPSSYIAATLIGWLSQVSAVEAYGFTDLFAFFLAGLALYLFTKSLGFSRISSFASAVFYMLSPQTLYGRFFVGQFTHDVSMFLVPLTFFLIIKFGKNVKKLALATAPFFALLFLTHLQTALSFGFMIAIYLLSNVILWVRGGDRKSISVHMRGIVLGGALGVSLSSFWLLPSLLEGTGMLGLSVDVAKKLMIPFETLFIDAENLGYLDPLQQLWTKQYFLGFPIVIFAFLALILIALKQLQWKKRSWGIIFALWAFIFLFGIVSPNIGLVLGWPNRLPYFVTMPMAMLAGLFVDWVADRLIPSSANSRSPRMFVACLILAALVLSPLIHAYSSEQFVYFPYVDEVEVSEHLETLGLDPTERVASFGTFSYVFNVFSDGWQLDGGYVQGQINPDFYYKYWTTLETGSLESILKTLNETNARYVIFQKGTEINQAYENQEYFEKSETSGFIIYRLRDTYRLDFVTIINGQAVVSYSYISPDELQISVQNCSNSVSLTVKMNYYQGWVAQATNGTVILTKDVNGLMKLDISNAAHLKIILSYGLTSNDYAGMAITVIGVAAYIFIFLAVIWKPNEGWNRTSHRGAIEEHLNNKKKELEKKKETTSKKPFNQLSIKPSLNLKEAKVESQKKEKASAMNQDRIINFFRQHALSIIIVSAYALYISWSYVSETGLPSFVDAPGHIFKVWNILDCWSKYKVIPYFWDSWWYAGYPFLQVYPPLSYVTAAFVGGVFLNGDPVAGFRWTMALSGVFSAIFMYFGVWMLFRSRMGGTSTAIVYVASPYRGTAVRTGMFPFFFATMFLPLIIPLFNRSLSSPSVKNFALSAVVLGLLLLAHMQLFIFAVLTLAMYSVAKVCLRFTRKRIMHWLRGFASTMGSFILIILITVCFAGFWLVPFLIYRNFFYTNYPEYYLEIQSIRAPELFFQQSGIYLGLASLITVGLAFFLNKRSLKDPFMVFFLVLTIFCGLLSVYQHTLFKGTFVEQIPYYEMITPDRWLFVMYLSLAFLVGRSTEHICELVDYVGFLSRTKLRRNLSKIFVVSMISLAIVFDMSALVKNFYEIPVIQSFPAAIKNLEDGDEFYRIYVDTTGSSYVPAVTNREIPMGWYVEGSVLRDWLYNLDWITSYGEREGLIPPLLELFGVKYYVVKADDSNRIERFSKTGEFDISYPNGLCVLQLNRQISYLSQRRAILYLGKTEDIINDAESVIFSSNSSIFVNGWKELVEDYTVDELSQFDAVFLHRYNTRDITKMEQLLQQYVEEGGTVLFDPFSPNSFLGMQMYLVESHGEYEIVANEDYSENVFQNVNISRFSPAVYAGNYPWGYVAFNTTVSQLETETLLTIDSNPVLAVSRLGEGRIVWIGFNFLTHINQFLNKDEGRMLDNLLKWTLGETSVIEVTDFEKYPYGYVDASLVSDKPGPFWLLISETYYPGWKVYINNKPVKVYMAEPKLMMVKVDSDAQMPLHVSLRYEMTEVHILGLAFTIGSILLILTYSMNRNYIKRKIL